MTRHLLSLLLVCMISANSLPLSSEILSPIQLGRQYAAIDERVDTWSQTDGMLLVTAPGNSLDTFLPIVLRGGAPAGTATPTATLTSTPTPTATLSGETATPTPTATATPTPTPTGTSSAMVLVSDDFNRANADRCALGATSNYAGGNKLYFVPLWPSGGSDPTNPIGANIVDQTLQNNGMDLGGVMLTGQPGACDHTSIRGIDLGQDLYVGVDVKVPTDSNNHITQAGPFLRGRAAARGEEISGGLNTGYWAVLDSTGYVHVVDLSNGALITDFTLSEFDPDYFYRVELTAKSILIQVKVYGPVGVGQRWAGNYQEMTASATINRDGVEIFSDGSVGINFGAEPNRGLIGGQQADNLIVSEYRSLD